MKRFNILQIAYSTKEGFLAKDENSIGFFDRGYVEIEDCQNHDDVWHICNWECYRSTKPSNLHSSIGFCNSDIVIWEDGLEKYWVAESVGWKMFKSLESAKSYMLETKEYRAWPFKSI